MGNERIRMPVRAKPFAHQIRAFEFVMEKFGLLQPKHKEPGNTEGKGGGGDEHFQ